MLAREFYFSRFSLWATWIFSGTKQQNKNDNKYILPFSEAFLCIAVGFQLTQFSILFFPLYRLNPVFHVNSVNITQESTDTCMQMLWDYDSQYWFH